jgi:hypothetical protein
MSMRSQTGGPEKRQIAEQLFNSPKREDAVRDTIAQELAEIRAKTARLRALRLSQANRDG